MKVPEFQKLVWEYYREHRRAMPWRDDPSPYNVVVSEVMLQQTQVSRVLEKFPTFITQFPSFEELAAAPAQDVLRAWQGMGYNRRALFLQRLAQAVVRDYGDQLPSDTVELVKLPGIGPGTAGSIAAFAFDQPAVFIETNIRRVFIHHFFAGSQSVIASVARQSNALDRRGQGLAMTIERPQHEKITDKQLLPLIEQALDRSNPREWYYALMDYGTHLATQVPNPNRRSRHYTRQSKFEGSDRQLRGAILRLYLAGGSVDMAYVQRQFAGEAPERVGRIVTQLRSEGLIPAG